MKLIQYLLKQVSSEITGTTEYCDKTAVTSNTVKIFLLNIIYVFTRF